MDKRVHWIIPKNQHAFARYVVRGRGISLPSWCIGKCHVYDRQSFRIRPGRHFRYVARRHGVYCIVGMFDAFVAAWLQSWIVFNDHACNPFATEGNKYAKVYRWIVENRRLIIPVSIYYPSYSCRALISFNSSLYLFGLFRKVSRCYTIPFINFKRSIIIILCEGKKFLFISHYVLYELRKIDNYNFARGHRISFISKLSDKLWSEI